MSYIPEDAEWYLADILMEITVEGDSRNVVHTNTVLIRAGSPDEAYEKALTKGRTEEISYQNPDGRLVTFLFKGLRDLIVIQEQLEDGAELTYTERIGMPEDELQKLITPKNELSVFEPISLSQGPDYSCGEIMKEVYERWPHLRR